MDSIVSEIISIETKASKQKTKERYLPGDEQCTVTQRLVREYTNRACRNVVLITCARGLHSGGMMHLQGPAE